jgi:hypothetical protein
VYVNKGRQSLRPGLRGPSLILMISGGRYLALSAKAASLSC